jgi:prefoldin subunit 5
MKLIEPGMTPEATIGAFRNLSVKYESMLNHLAMRDLRISEKIEEITKSVGAISHLSSHQDEQLTVQYELGDTMFANARLPASAKVNLWLGANVMLEYELEDAKGLLEEKLADNKAALERIKHDQMFVREQITVLQVSTSRLVNHIIETRKNTAA